MAAPCTHPRAVGGCVTSGKFPGPGWGGGGDEAPWEFYTVTGRRRWRDPRGVEWGWGGVGVGRERTSSTRHGGRGAPAAGASGAAPGQRAEPPPPPLVGAAPRFGACARFR